MKVHELIAALQKMDPNHVVVLEMDDDFWHIAMIDTVALKDPETIPVEWDADAYEAGDYVSNAVRICA